MEEQKARKSLGKKDYDDAVSSNSVLDRVDTKKITMNDILGGNGQFSDASESSSNKVHYKTGQVLQSSNSITSSKRQRKISPSPEPIDPWAELPESSSPSEQEPI